jgi:hypothetical protein
MDTERAWLSRSGYALIAKTLSLDVKDMGGDRMNRIGPDASVHMSSQRRLPVTTAWADPRGAGPPDLC